jgi:tRNA pseudouridine55 synthase
VPSEDIGEEARANLATQIPPRIVTIFQIEILNYAWPTLIIRAHVSSGTYIRSLATDIGRELGCGAYTRHLRRIKIANYDVKDAQKLDDFLD